MKKVMVTVAPGFEEIETITVVDILRRAGARVDLAGTQPEPIEGSRGVRILPDVLLSEIDHKDYDMVVLPGGQPGTTNLQNNESVIAIVQNMNRDQKTVAAICAAPMVLQTAGVLKDHRTTSHPSVQENLNGIRYSDDRVVVDGNLVTSRSPGTALEFAMKLVEVLFGPDRVETVNKGVMARI
ncbi:DJ-1 family glyoxalase III [Nitrospina gracilis]|uniref:DJ-1 family glyoxalase III n=1 Tax=Nitrospina gracilis TaxID=35801 RepID=UPI001F217928|nr:DJ-1 family glyoxalase III [Nitrospina gracilis]MCF8720647.1 4-methyl-5(b-hydroxyethyl)-thiazole monophosphate biosynthesis [Nitrospina gracilis Nb-211]